VGPLGIQETVFIFVLALLIFGPKKLPELGRTIGKAMTEFRRASSDLRATFDREMNSIEREANLKEVTQNINSDLSNHDSYYDSNYDSNYYDYGSYDSTSQDTSTVSASATQGAETDAGEGQGDVSSQPVGAENEGERHQADTSIAGDGELSDRPEEPSGHPIRA
jgi:TatA/E family protein of Tat protein translocase